MNRSIIRDAIACFILLMITTLTIQSQDPVLVERSNNKVVIAGTVYYVHVVKPGHTLFSIAKAYNVSEKEIVIENPGVSSDLRIAQVLKIPANPSAAYSVVTVEPEKDEIRHVVKAGETLYSISRTYGCTDEMLLQLNPDLNIDDIPIGYALNIPSGKETKNDLSFDEEGFILHKVKRRETLYSISRYYSVGISEIKAVNKEIGWGGPRIGDLIKIPKPNTTASVLFKHDSLISDTLDLMIKDSLYIEPYTYDDLMERQYSGRRTFDVAYLVPFNFTAQEPLDTLLKDIKSPVRRKHITEQYLLGKKTPQSVQFLEFFEGSMMAIDTLTDAGLKVNVHFLDTRKSMAQTRKILDQPWMHDMDLIIGPFYTYNLELVSEFCKKNRIPLLTPFHSDDSLALNNPYLFQLTPSYKTEYRKNVQFLARSYNDNLIFLHSGDSSQLDKIDFYKSILFSELEKHSALEAVLFKEVVIRDGNMADLLHALNPELKNTIILPATDEAFASQVATTLYYQIEDFDIQIFGSPYWVGFDDIEIDYIHELQLTISHTHKYNFENPAFLHMLKKFRHNYFKEPSSYTRNGLNFGLLGYDISLYFLSALMEYGPRFILKLDEFQPNGMLTEFRFERLSRASGYENQMLKFYSFDKDMNVYEVSLPEMPETHHFLEPAEEEELPFFRWFENRTDTTKIENTVNER
jgi:LysM repeat protein